MSSCDDAKVTHSLLCSCNQLNVTTHPKFILRFEAHLKRTAELVSRNGDVNLGDDFVRNVLEFETSLAHVSMKPEQAREYPLYYTNTTLKALYSSINDLRALPSKQDNYPEVSPLQHTHALTHALTRIRARTHKHSFYSDTLASFAYCLLRLLTPSPMIALTGRAWLPAQRRGDRICGSIF